MKTVVGVVPGHGLQHEGAAFELVGGRAGLWRRVGPGSGGDGHGLCSCGESSPWLPSKTQRKQWHRDHKADVLKGRR